MATDNIVANPFSEGTFVVVDKPLHWTSFDVVNKFRYLLTKKLGIKRLKVGHAGALDPLATGVVVLCTGKYTKRIDEVMKNRKVYTATITLGATTPSYDMESSINATYPTEHITEELIHDVLGQFVGEIKQVPPLFSAVKVDGKRAYHLARKGENVQLPAKDITIYGIDLLHTDLPNITLKITCGKGTYIRSLARDIGRALGSGGYLSFLRRDSVGDFDLSNSVKVEDFEEFIEEKIRNYRG